MVLPVHSSIYMKLDTHITPGKREAQSRFKHLAQGCYLKWSSEHSAGIEPRSLGLQSQHSNHWATKTHRHANIVHMYILWSWSVNLKSESLSNMFGVKNNSVGSKQIIKSDKILHQTRSTLKNLKIEWPKTMHRRFNINNKCMQYNFRTQKANALTV